MLLLKFCFVYLIKYYICRLDIHNTYHEIYFFVKSQCLYDIVWPLFWVRRGAFNQCIFVKSMQVDKVCTFKFLTSKSTLPPMSLIRLSEKDLRENSDSTIMVKPEKKALWLYYLCNVLHVMQCVNCKYLRLFTTYVSIFCLLFT